MAEHRLFFTAFAQNWCENDRQDIAIDSLESDEHSPAKYRVLGVLSNFKPFSQVGGGVVWIVGGDEGVYVGGLGVRVG